MAEQNTNTDHARRKSAEGSRSVQHPDSELDYPFMYPTTNAQKQPLLQENNNENDLNESKKQAQPASVQRPSSLRPLKEGETGTKAKDANKNHGYPNDRTETARVSFATDGKGKIPMDKHRSAATGNVQPRRKSSQRRPSRLYSVSEQRTIGGKCCAIWRNIYTVLGLRQWAVLLVLVAYSLLGGLIFSWLEKGHTRRQNEILVKDLESERANITGEFFTIINEPWLYPDHTSQREAMMKKLKEYQYGRGLGPKAKPVWDLWDGVFFSFTVFTTIGYGHYTPVTKSGRVATIVYALIGIPLLLAILADFGRGLTRVLKRMWTHVRNGIRRVLKIRKLRKLQQAAQKAGLDVDEAEGEGVGGISEEDEEFNFPIPLAIFLIVSWLFICAAFFLIWEKKWTYFEAFYFFFISLSTIGLGDLVPEHQKYMIANFPFVLIGLSLVTLVINLIQNKIEEMKQKAESMLDDQMGVEDEGTETESEGEQPEAGKDVHWPRPGEEEEDKEKPTPSTPLKPKPGLPSVVVTPAKKVGKTQRPYPQGRTNLGIIQTYALPRNRRRIGTQTDDSHVRDSIKRQKKLGFGATDSRHSMLSGNSEYFDAQSLP